MKHLTSIVLLLLAQLISPPIHAKQTDILTTGGCIERPALQEFISSHKGTVIFQFEGNYLFNEFAEDTRLTFIRYQFGEEFRTALIVRDRPFDTANPNDSSKACVVFLGDDRGSIVNPKESGGGATWWFDQYSEDSAIERCKKIRSTVYSVWSRQTEEFGGKRMTRAQSLYMGDAVLNGKAAADRSRNEFEERLKSTSGDPWCASPTYLKKLAADFNQKLVALLTGQRMELNSPKTAEPAVLLAIYAPVAQGPSSRGWSMYLVQPSGASYRIANGHGFRHCEDCFARPK